MRILVVDNYDSFTYNLVDYLEQGSASVDVLRNDDPELKKLDFSEYSGIVLSPGPGRPQQAGCLMQIIEQNIENIPLLGICLGHQAIGQHLGCSLDHAPSPRHGKTSEIFITKEHPIWNGLEHTIEVMRYHSLVLTEINTQEIIPLAYSSDDHTLMSYACKSSPSIGLQFHPESIGSRDGLEIIKNWLQWIS